MQIESFLFAVHFQREIFVVDKALLMKHARTKNQWMVKVSSSIKDSENRKRVECACNNPWSGTSRRNVVLFPLGLSGLCLCLELRTETSRLKSLNQHREFQSKRGGGDRGEKNTTSSAVTVSNPRAAASTSRNCQSSNQPGRCRSWSWMDGHRGPVFLTC